LEHETNQQEGGMSTSDSMAGIPGPGGRGVLGVHLDIASLRLVEVVHGHVVRWANLAYPPGLQPNAKEFVHFLKTSVADFATGLRRPSVWVVGPTPSQQVRFLSLPKVRARQMSNLVYWTFRKEIPFDPAQTVFDFDVEGDASVPGPTRKVDVTAYTVAQAEIDALVDLFNRAGCRMEGLVIPSFAMRNLFRGAMPGSSATTLGLYVGEDSSSLLFVKGRQVVSHRVFKTGMNVVLDLVRDRFPDWTPAQAYQAINDALLASVAPSDAAERRLSADPRGIADMVRIAFGRLIQQVERSMSAYLAGRSDEEIKLIQVAGSLASLSALVDELGARLGIESRPLDLFQPRLMQGKTPPPETSGEGGALAIALGAGLSDNAHTPNLLHTYVKRELEVRRTRTKSMVMAVGVVLLAGLGVLHGVVHQANLRLRREVAAVQAKMQAYAPYPDRAGIQRMVGQGVADAMQLKQMADRHQMMAALNQLALETPEAIRLVSVVLERGEAAGEGKGARKKGDGKKAEAEVRIHIEGMVLGEPGVQAAKLASYLLRLERSPLFEQLALASSAEGREGADPVLLFQMDMKMAKIAPAHELAAKEGGGI
jgi:Tfp pilus assembly PilM family ATPase